MSDAVQLLSEQHAEVTALFMKLDRLADPRTSLQVFRLIDGKLRDHATIEEQIFYPAFRERARNHMQEEEIAQALHEHSEMKAALAECERVHVGGDAFARHTAHLKQLVQEHVQEEERGILRQARRLFTQDQLDDLGSQMIKRASLHSSVYEMAGPSAKT